MTASVRSRIAALLRAAVPLVITAVAVAVLLRFPPDQYTFYPQCPIYRYLHLQCLGCGATRALAALLHGDIAEALRMNALTTLLAPFAAIYAAFCYRCILWREPVQLPQLPRPAVYMALGVAVLFAIVRNLGHV
ncbi:MAG TPA: DUF2752 domain-containing protein [Edaphobacter sp.]|uniref:DUF2752 domain-containing protein n=1 Tax=Edaphobacter sp. TaxID=1934404 RepID=UPI002C286F90|nr:DUF2752 domain-containing protein [Edaphobacter sp.]HUZ97697.1 DUF2752 domain-containing protein [Edaphobacter sp.]